MHSYLRRFRARLVPFEGSLVRPADLGTPTAKHFLGALAKEGAVARVAWGWYYVPPLPPPATVFGFLTADRHFKVLIGQSAASLWNGDFVHRDAITVATDDASYARALRAFGRKCGWAIHVEVDPRARDIPTREVDGLLVQTPEATVIDCIQRWAFVDAAATLTPGMQIQAMQKDSYWKRVQGTSVRVGQALAYTAHRLFGADPPRRISDEYVRAELDEAVEKVKALA